MGFDYFVKFFMVDIDNFDVVRRSEIVILDICVVYDSFKYCMFFDDVVLIVNDCY